MTEKNHKHSVKIFSLIITLIFTLFTNTACGESEVADSGGNQPANGDIAWDYEADVVVVGAGASGLPAALKL